MLGKVSFALQIFLSGTNNVLNNVKPQWLQLVKQEGGGSHETYTVAFSIPRPVSLKYTKKNNNLHNI